MSGHYSRLRNVCDASTSLFDAHWMLSRPLGAASAAADRPRVERGLEEGRAKFEAKLVGRGGRAGGPFVGLPISIPMSSPKTSQETSPCGRLEEET